MKKKCNYNLEWRFEKDLIDYDQALKFMAQRVEEIYQKKSSELIWVLEHPPIYTAGISAKDSDLLDLGDSKIYKTNRGGKYTHHCPGMKIIYAMIDLKNFSSPSAPDVGNFVNFLERWIIAVLDHYGIEGHIRKNRVGIWVETKEGDGDSDKKISAIGIKLKKWVSYHGIAVNVNCDLSGFKKIIPCGITQFGVTSIQDLGYDTKTKEFEENFYKILQEKFYQLLNPSFFNS
jgi:lipoyl(octanoyl) transferase